MRAVRVTNKRMPSELSDPRSWKMDLESITVCLKASFRPATPVQVFYPIPAMLLISRSSVESWAAKLFLNFLINYYTFCRNAATLLKEDRVQIAWDAPFSHAVSLLTQTLTMAGLPRICAPEDIFFGFPLWPGWLLTNSSRLLLCSQKSIYS